MVDVILVVFVFSLILNFGLGVGLYQLYCWFQRRDKERDKQVAVADSEKFAVQQVLDEVVSLCLTEFDHKTFRDEVYLRCGRERIGSKMGDGTDLTGR